MTDREIAQGFPRLLMVEITIEHLTAKQAIELTPATPTAAAEPASPTKRY